MKQRCTICGKQSIPGLVRGKGKCQYHWNALIWGQKWADEVETRNQDKDDARQEERSPPTTGETMTHELWASHAWENASHEAVIQALLNPPTFPDPRDMGEIKRRHPRAIAAYQSLYYDGATPKPIADIRKRSIGI